MGHNDQTNRPEWEKKKREILGEKDESEKGETIPGEKGRTKVWEISLEQSPGTSCWDGLG